LIFSEVGHRQQWNSDAQWSRSPSREWTLSIVTVSWKAMNKAQASESLPGRIARKI
jgi:hypothetical protein